MLKIIFSIFKNKILIFKEEGRDIKLKLKSIDGYKKHGIVISIFIKGIEITITEPNNIKSVKKLINHFN